MQTNISDDEKNYSPRENTRHCPSLFMHPVDDREIFRIIMNLPNKFSAGVDEIPIFLLKHVAEFISTPLSIIINECLIEGIFPEELKKAKIVPVYKKGDSSKVSSYRPVSLLPSVSKVFERAIYDRLISFIDKNNIFVEHQFGFRQNRSTELAIYDMLSYIHSELDKTNKIAGLYFDLSRAFDTVDHDLIKQKLEVYGIRGIPLKLFVSYLTQRRQIVCIKREGNDYYSEWANIEQGVPQGSILGPPLFLLLVNDLDGAIGGGRVCQYADDTSVVLAGQSPAGLSVCCSHVAGLVADWCVENCLRLNSEKTGLITFSKTGITNESLYVRLNHRSIPVIKKTKFLGVILDSALSWEPHIKALSARLSSMCALIRRLRNIVSVDSFRLFYFSNIQSIISYGIIFWGSSSFAIRVFRAQKRIIRCLLNLQPRDTCKPHFTSLNVLTVPSLYYLHLVLFVRKHGSLFPTNRDLYAENMNITTRTATELSIPGHKSTFFEKGPLYKAIKAYRSLPKHIKLIADDGRFKRVLNQYLLDKCLYSFDFLSP